MSMCMYRVRAQQKSIEGKFLMSAQQSDIQKHWKIIDSHVHVWASPEEAKTFPYFPGQEPATIGSSDLLLKAMEEGGVDGALIVQQISHMFDHSYLSRVLQMNPGKFVGCCLANPSDGVEGVSELEGLVTKEGYQAVRFNPYLWPSNQKMTNAVGKALFAKAGELGILVGFMCFKGLLQHIEDIEQLCGEFPRTRVLIDHLGFCKPPLNDSEMRAWECLLGLSKYPQVYVKLSAFFRTSREQFPYEDLWPLFRTIIATFGPKRLLWGSDFPFVVDECGYTNARRVLELAKYDIGITDEDMQWIMGETAMQLFKGRWVPV
ncbi:hypothetical protein KP509_36G042300 [Ceratopteris richardii]|uniref:Amidohydrolase-related domain-containing protein n=1 Tax=Ceratopteris richardii TaxID=49495 RepID=A0A8T2QDS6_CERRI|nr:hypothetical protein KP509_36G042300 [Ceratopteris richardii]